MANRYLLESSAVDGYLLEDGTGVLLKEWLEIVKVSGSESLGIFDTNIRRQWSLRLIAETLGAVVKI